MQDSLKTLLKEFLTEDQIASIASRAEELHLTTKVRKIKGRWQRETISKLIKERGNICQYCSVSGDESKLTIDHIVPKKMLLDMGLDEFYDDEENLEILCTKCNGRKGSQLDFGNNKTIVLLTKYIKIYKDRRGLS